jgi:hypothetical protein
MHLENIVVSHVGNLTEDGVWFDNKICITLTTRKYNSLSVSDTLQLTTARNHSPVSSAVLW